MEEKFKKYSEIEKYEIININNGEKYGFLMNNDILIDENGSLKFLIVNKSNQHFSFLKSSDFLELPWDCVNKIGSKTIILDVEEEDIKKSYK